MKSKQSNQDIQHLIYGFMANNEEQTADQFQQANAITDKEMEKFCLFKQPPQNHWESKAYELTGVYIKRQIQASRIDDPSMPNLSSINERIIHLTMITRTTQDGISFYSLSKQESAELALLKYFEAQVRRLVSLSAVTAPQKSLINEIANYMISLHQGVHVEDATRTRLKQLKTDAKVGHFFQTGPQKIIKELCDAIENALSNNKPSQSKMMG